MTVDEALRNLAKAIEDENEGFLDRSFKISNTDGLQITVVRKRNGKSVIKKMGRLDDMSDPYALQGSGKQCPACGGSGTIR